MNNRASKRWFAAVTMITVFSMMSVFWQTSAAQAAPGDSGQSSPTATRAAKVPASSASLTLSVIPAGPTSDVAAGDTLAYAVTLANGPVAVSTITLGSGLSGTAASSSVSWGACQVTTNGQVEDSDIDPSSNFDLPAGTSLQCPATYTVTDDDIAAGGPIVLSASATGSVAKTQVTSNTDSASATLAPAPEPAAVPAPEPAPAPEPVAEPAPAAEPGVAVQPVPAPEPLISANPQPATETSSPGSGENSGETTTAPAGTVTPLPSAAVSPATSSPAASTPAVAPAGSASVTPSSSASQTGSATPEAAGTTAPAATSTTLPVLPITLGGVQPISSGSEPLSGSTIEPVGSTLTASPAAPSTFQPIQLLAATDDDHCLVLGVTATLASQCYPPQVGDQVLFTLSMRVNQGCGEVRKEVVTASPTMDLFNGAGPSAGTPVTCSPNIPANRDTVSCYGAYTLQQSDFDNNGVNIRFSVTGYHPNDKPYGSGPFVIDYTFPLVAMSMDKTVEPTTVERAGDTVTYTYTVTNSGQVPLINPTIEETGFTGTGTLDPAVCDSNSLEPGESTTCTTTYTVTTADAVQGVIDNAAIAHGLDVPSPGCANPTEVPVASGSSSAQVTIPPLAELDVTKTADAKNIVVGQQVLYTYHVTNTGNQTLTNVRVDETNFSGTGPAPVITCPTGPLAPGDSTDCTGTYTVTQQDFDNGTLTNSGTAEADGPNGQKPSDDSNGVDLTAQGHPSVELDKTATTDVLVAGETVRYNYTVRNTGDETLTNVAVSDRSFTGQGTAPVITCPATTVAPGGAITCTADYRVTQEDVDNGSVVNVGTVTADAPHDVTVTADSPGVELRTVPDLALTVDKSADTTQIIKAGQVVTYTYLVTNKSNETVHDLTVAETGFTGTGDVPQVQCQDETLRPQQPTLCTATYTVTQEDIDNNTVDNIGTATASDPHGTPVSANSNDWTLTALAQPSLTIKKSADMTYLVAGQTVNYTFVVTNTGNETLYNLVVTDDGFTGTDPASLSPVTCDATTIGVGGSVTCHATYLVNQDDVDQESVSNQATATANDRHDRPASAQADAVTLTTDQSWALSVVKTGSTSALVAGQTVTYTFDVTNDSSETVHGMTVSDGAPAFTGTGPLPLISCPVTTIAPKATVSCSVDYTVTQADVDQGTVVNTGTATAYGPYGQPVSQTSRPWTMTTTPAPDLRVVKTSSTSTLIAGTTVQYSFVVTNMGNETLDNVQVTDLGTTGTNPVSAIDCPGTVLGPQEAFTCTATYLVSQQDVDNGSVVNTATASGTDPQNQTIVPTEPAKNTMTAPRNPKVAITKSASTAELVQGNQVVYSFIVTNPGNETLTNVAVTDADFTGTGDPLNVSCSSTTVSPGGSVSCSATYTVTQADVDQLTVVNTAVATAVGPHGDNVSAPSNTVTLTTRPDPQIKLQKVGSTPYLVADQPVTYTYTVTNPGNETLYNVQVADDATSFTGSGQLSPLTCSGTSVGPGGSVICTAQYTVTQDDVDQGTVSNTATATAVGPNGETPLPSSSTYTMTVYQANPQLTLTKAANMTTLVAGQDVAYSFTVQNTGNETLHDVTINDHFGFTGNGNLPDVSCSPVAVRPGGTLTCSVTYRVTQADVDQGQVDNTATAWATDPHGGTTPIATSNTVSLKATANPKLTLTKSADATGLTNAGQEVNYTFNVTNVGNVTLHNIAVAEATFTGTGGAPQVTCPPLTTAIAPNETLSCTATYIVTQQDMDNGFITNSAIAPAAGPHDEQTSAPSNEVTLRVVPVPNALKVDKELVPSAAGPTGASGAAQYGDTLTYKISVTNVGNRTLSNVRATDTLTNAASKQSALDLTGCQLTTVKGAIDVSTTLGLTMAPGDVLACQAAYKVTVADMNAKATNVDAQISNVANATGNPPGISFPVSGVSDPVVTDLVTAGPNVKGVKVLDPGQVVPAEAGETLAFTITATNTGDQTATNVIPKDKMSTGKALELTNCQVNDATDTTLPVPSLDPGDWVTCQASYLVTQDDIDAQKPLVNSVTVEWTTVNDTTEDQPGQGVEVPVEPAAPNLTLQNSVSPGKAVLAGDPATWTMVIANEGNVSLTGIVLNDAYAPDARLKGKGFSGANTWTVPTMCQTDTGTMVALADAELAPGQALTCTVPYTVLQVDVDAGIVFNSALISAAQPNGESVAMDEEKSHPTANLALEPTPGLTVSLAKPTGGSGPSGAATENDTLSYVVTVTNTGTVTLTDVGVTDTLTNASGADVPTDWGDCLLFGDAYPAGGVLSDNYGETLAPGDYITCSTTYDVTQADLDAYAIDPNVTIASTAHATGTTPTWMTPPKVTADSETVTTRLFAIGPVFVVDKEVDGQVSQVAAGDLLTYTITYTNTGDETSANVNLTDVMSNGKTLPVSDCTLDGQQVDLPMATLLPDQTVICHVSYTVTQDDIDAQQGLSNKVVVRGTGPGGESVDGEDETPQIPTQAAASSLALTMSVEDQTKTVSTASLLTPPVAEVGDVLVYTITAVNDGNITLDNVTVATGDFNGLGGDAPSLVGCTVKGVPVVNGHFTLAPGESAVCTTTTYTVVQADVDRGTSIDNNATATGDPRDPEGVELNATASVSIDVAGARPDFDVTKTVDQTTDVNAGDVLHYAITAVNTGNVTLTHFSINESEKTPFTGQ
ncbi:MAG: hypothetical protein FWF43_01790, partial [Propionibacteriaceae bacterium]|nr:hypothetical protein [Propionibacteriaceae bacterium]